MQNYKLNLYNFPVTINQTGNIRISAQSLFRLNVQKILYFPLTKFIFSYKTNLCNGRFIGLNSEGIGIVSSLK